MSITERENRLQVCCDACPACHPNSYAHADFAVMIADTKAAGLKIRRIPADIASDHDTRELFDAPPSVAGATKRVPYSTCPSCTAAAGEKDGGLPVTVELKRSYGIGRSRSGAPLITTPWPDGSWHLKKRLPTEPRADGRQFEVVATIDDLTENAILMLAVLVRNGGRRRR